ncbi:MAG: hypothetical protein M1511_12970 [Deltaproteobacteria bacterium]|nr:hypothetical protein [Deltaproteobacteria bacterium]
MTREHAELYSDIDLLADMEPERTIFVLAGLLYELQEPLGVAPSNLERSCPFIRDDRARLIDMLDTMQNVQNYGILEKDRFQKDELVRTSHCL